MSHCSVVTWQLTAVPVVCAPAFQFAICADIEAGVFEWPRPQVAGRVGGFVVAGVGGFLGIAHVVDGEQVPGGLELSGWVVLHTALGLLGVDGIAGVPRAHVGHVLVLVPGLAVFGQLGPAADQASHVLESL